MLFSTVCFSQIYDLIRTAEYNNSEYTTAKKKFEFCGMARNFNPLIDISKFQNSTIKKDTNPDSQKQIIRIHCFATINKNESPLIVIDGVPFEMANLKSLNPNDIETINILKDATASAIFSCRPSNYNGIILITTKQSKLQQFIIKDFLDGNPIPAATVSFISMDRKDTIMMAANDSGVVVTDQLNRSISYEVKVSAIGYKLLNQNFKPSYKKIPQELLLERAEKFCTEVILNSGHYHGCPKYYCTRKISECSMQVVNDTTYPIPNILVTDNSFVHQVFPNPAQRGTTITIKTETLAAEQVLVELTDLSGKLVLSQPQQINKGYSRITLQTDSRWAAGIYLLHVYAKGKLLASDKIIIQ